MAHDIGRDKNAAPSLFSTAPWAPVAIDMWMPVFNGWKCLNGTCSAKMTSLGEELTSFVGRRVHEDLSLPQQLAACKGPEEVMRTYVSFYQKAIDDYQKELSQLAKIGGELAGESVASFQKGVEDASTAAPTKH